MPFSAGAIVSKLTLDKSQFSSAISGAKAETKSLQTAIQQHAGGFRKAGMAMTVAGAAIIGTLGMMVKKYVDAGDQIQKMAIRTGFSTETLSELRYAADISGTSIEGLEKSTLRMSRTIVDAGDGLETAQRALDRLGLKAEDLRGMKIEDQFLKIGYAISEIEDPTLKAATAQEIFGRSGTQLLPLFAEGAAGLDNLRKQAHELGIVYDKEAADKAAKLQDAQTTLNASLRGLSMVVAEHIVPSLTKAVEWVSQMIVKVKDWTKEHPELFNLIIKVSGALGGFMLVAGPLLIALPSLAGGIGMVTTALSLLAGPAGLAALAIAGIVLSINDLIKSHKRALEQITATAAGIKAQAVSIEQIAMVWEKARQIGGKTLKDWEELWSRVRGNTIEAIKAILTEPKYAQLKAVYEDIAAGIITWDSTFKDLEFSSIKLKNPLLEVVEAGKEVVEVFNKIYTLPKPVIPEELAEGGAEIDLAWTQFSATFDEGHQSFQQGITNMIAGLNDYRVAELDAAATAQEAAESRQRGLGLVYEGAKGLLAKLAMRSKAAAYALAIINTAEGVTKALASSIPPFNIALAAITAAAGAVEIATIAGTPTPLQKGAIFQRPTYLLGEGASPEVLLPLERLPEMLRKTFGRTGPSVVFSPIFNINALDPLTTRDMVRQEIAPQMLEMLRNKIMLPEFKTALGVT